MRHTLTKTRTVLATSATAACLLGSTASADIIHADDVIINGGSLCVGFDCVNGESFGSDTLRLKENNLRIHFDDTSTSASFPRNDWRIKINDTTNGGASYFAIQDSTAGRTPFRIEAGAPNNTLYVEDDGDVGIKTSTPVVDLHIVEGNTPTLRLEQDGSDGFSPQTWDIAGNEANFFIRDVTHGSALPFRIFPDAPGDALTIKADGHVTVDNFLAVGHGTPLGDVHIAGDGTARRMIVLEQTTAASQWLLQNYETGATEGAGNFGINLVGSGNVLKFDTAGDAYFPKLPNCASGIKTDAAGKLSCI